MSPLPFLRAPPFPNIAPTTAAISFPAELGTAVASVSEEAIVLIADGRVGGAFWGKQVEGVKVVVRMGVPVAPTHLAPWQARQIAFVGKSDSRAGGGIEGRRLTNACDPWTLLREAVSVHADADDELALVAGLLGLPVFGSDNRQIDAGRLRARLREALGAASYRDCFTGAAVNIEEAIGQLVDWRRHLDGVKDIAAASGFALWKREAMRQFLWDGTAVPPFLSPARGLQRAVGASGALAIWPSRVPPSIDKDAVAHGVPLARVEDGFLRSRGLGVALHPPGSVVIDRTGLYYDARGPSDLETLLLTHDFPPALIARARRLRARICASGVTKYGMATGEKIDLPVGRRTVLAVGQVDDDMSVRLGGAGVGGNLDFLTRVRLAEPDAWIIYRPHPDVQAGHRQGHLPNSTILHYANRIDTGASVIGLMQAVDEVHVLSSLTGFEALMRDRSVTVHGMPFYAGWGLTRDLAQPTGRRSRRLTIDQLVAGSLILYPRYLDPVSRLPCSPELMVERLTSGAAFPLTWLMRVRALQGKLQRLFAEIFHG